MQKLGTRKERSVQQALLNLFAAVLFPVILVLTSCSVASIGQTSHASNSGKAPTATPATPLPTSGSEVSSDIPLFESASAIQAMQAWASQVRSGRINDGSNSHSLSNSGFIRDQRQSNSYMPYGVTIIHHSFPWGSDTLGVVIGTVEYVFELGGATGSAASAHYGLLLGTISTSGQPVTMLIWLSSPTLLNKPSVGLSLGDGDFTASGSRFYRLAHDSDAAAWLGSRSVLKRTVSVNFYEQLHYSISVPITANGQPAILSRNSGVLSLVAHPATHQVSDGVFDSLPPAGFTIALQDGAESPSAIVLPSPRSVDF